MAPANCKTLRRGSFIRLVSSMLKGIGLLALDVGRLDDGPPLFGFRLLKSGERLRRLLIARRDLRAEFAELGAHVRIRQCLNGGGIQLADDIRRRALWRPNAKPDRGIESRKAGFIGGRHVRQTWMARL